MREDPETIISMMKADKKAPSEEPMSDSSVYLVADGKKITDPKEISTYVKEKVMPMCGMGEMEDKEEPNENKMKENDLSGLNLN